MRTRKSWSRIGRFLGLAVGVLVLAGGWSMMAGPSGQGSSQQGHTPDANPAPDPRDGTLDRSSDPQDPGLKRRFASDDVMSAMGRLAQRLAETRAASGTLAAVPSGGDTGDEDEEEAPAGGQAETSVAVDSTGMHVVAGFNDTRGFNLNPTSVSGYMYSDDGGVTFTDGGQLPITTGTSTIGTTVFPQVFGDPEVKYLGGCNFVYFSIMVKKISSTGTAQTMCVHRSTDCGHTWTGPYEVTPATNPHGLTTGSAGNARDSADKEFADVDPETGRVMMSWSNFTSTAFAAGGIEISTTFSDNIMSATPPTWSTRSILGATSAEGQASLPRFAGNGSSNVYVAWRRFPGTNLQNVGFARSTDNGVTWSPAFSLTTSFFAMDYELGNDRPNTSPSLAVDNSPGAHQGNIYVVYGNNSNHDGQDVAFQRSLDGGLTWSAPVLLNSRPGSDRSQWYSWVTVDKDTGRVYVFYYDQGVATSGDLTQTTYLFSDDGGATWSRPMALSDRPFKAGWGNDTGQPNLGDYNQAVAQGGELFVTWAGTELKGFADQQPLGNFSTPDVFFKRAPAVKTSLDLGTVTFTDGNANGFIDAGEQVHLQMPLRNYDTNPLHAGTLTGITGTLSTATPGVSVTTATSSYPDLAAGASGSNATDYVLQLAPSFVPGTHIELSLAVSTDQGTTTLLFTQATGTPGPTVLLSEDFNGVAPGSLPAGWTAANGAKASGSPTVPWTTSNTFFGTTSNAAFHQNANDGAGGTGNPTRWERLISPVFSVPANAEYVTIDMDVAYDTEDDPNFNILAYDGFFLRITDQTTGRVLISALAEAFDEEFTTGSLFHYPKHLPRSSNAAYFPNGDMSVWAGDSQGFRHVHMKFPGPGGLAGGRAQLRFEYTQDSGGTCANVRPGHQCGVMVDNVVVKSVASVQADLSIAKSAAPAVVTTGSNVTYTLTATNNGPSPAAPVTVSDTLPATLSLVSCAATGGGVCGGSGNNVTVTFPSLASGQTATITLVAALDCAVADGAVVSNTATIGSTTPDNDSSNNSSTATFTASNPPPVITCPADVTVTAPYGAASEIVTYSAPTATDNCPGPVVTSSPASGSSFPVGATTVNASATDSGGATATCSFMVNVLAPTTTTVSPAAGQYSDPVSLTATVSPATLGSESATGSVAFLVDGNPAGSAPINALGVATVTYTITQPQGPHAITATFTSTNPFFLGSNGSGTLTVSREDAVVTPAASNPMAVMVGSPGGTGSFTLQASINEVADGSPGNISLASPVTMTLAPVGPGFPISCVATLSGGGVGGTLAASCAFSSVPVNVYDVHIVIGGDFYAGAASSVVTVFDPSLGFVTGGGTVVHDGVTANFGFNAKYQKDGSLQGSFLYIEHRPGGDVQLKSTSMGSLAIVGNMGILLGTGSLNGAAGYGFQVSAVDNGEPGSSDQFGLQVTDPTGAGMPDLTFPLTTLSGGNVQVPH